MSGEHEDRVRSWLGMTMQMKLRMPLVMTIVLKMVVIRIVTMVDEWRW